ncbi:BamA/TamA family outer membrane protein [Pseudooceanicola sp.]|uniref:autotransporter assembly complex protein TamA n=1 Tax=Pseudooceanicola sp. TaxID=1914328 RepID=UPI00261DA92A|nr:BamA/TamA family outer membrane protein [Pseudooceanicola sp.]MDF1854642.1 BamA/TamA family outer membrane protein [Pseudooceanicola sp.]
MFRPLLAALAAGLFSVTDLSAATVEVKAEGADKALLSALRDASLSVGAIAREVSDGQELLAAAQADYKRMVAALYAAGRFGGAVSIKVDGREAAALSVLNKLPEIDRIEIAVTPGPAYRFAEARIAPLPGGATPAPGFAVGALATTPAMRKAAEAGVTGWREIGHAKARVAGQQITANHTKTEIRASIALDPGPRLRFGATQIASDATPSKVRPERIRAIAGIETGTQFSPDEVAAAERRLRRTGAFRSAVVSEAEQPNPDASLDMIVAVEDAKPRRFGFGVEASTTEGASVTTYWLHRNLLGGAERFRVDASLKGLDTGTLGGDTDGIDYGITASLIRPAFRHPDMNLRFAANLQHVDEPAYWSNLAEATIGVQRFVSEEITLDADIGLRLAHVSDAYGTRNFNHLIGRAAITWDRRNNDLDPTRGFFLNAEAKPFFGLDGSDTGARLFTDLRAYVPLGSDRFSLAGRVQAGSVVMAPLSGTPPEYLFFSGGGGTVRGQDYQSLGGSTIAGQQVGGRSFLGLSGEVRAKITSKIGLVGFVDYGYVAADTQFGGGTWHGGAGLGGRYYTPIGPIRVDVAVPVTGPSGLGVYVGIGQAF